MKRNIFSILGIVALAGALAACKHDLDQAQLQTAKLGALEFAGPDFTVVSVAPQDSDGDGNVTVTLRPLKGGGNYLELLCGYKGGAGCKLKPR